MSLLKKLFGGAKPTEPKLLGGREDLEVVGESFYQESLRKVVGATAERTRVAVNATLVPEPDNEYDPNAVSVWISGMKVGHLSREDAARLRPGLLALQGEHRTTVALPGVVVGGGPGSPSYGVFLNYDPTAFGLAGSPVRATRVDVRVRTGLSEAIADDEENDDYDLDWQDKIPDDRLEAMTYLREALATEAEPVSRHFMHAHLEDLLYGARDDFSSALHDFDTACEAHHADMALIRPALIKTFGGLPMLEVYKQAAIRHQKAHDWASALRWAEAGIAAYGSDALRSEFPDDLAKRSANYREKLEPAPAKKVRPPRQEATEPPPIETFTCESCGRDFSRPRTRGRKPHQCPECRGVADATP